MRIVFMGTPDFAVPSLDILVKNGYNIVGVVTATDKWGGRGGKTLIQSPIKRYALANNLTVLQPANLKSPAFVDLLKMLKADLQVVVAFRMLPEVVWNMPPLGTINLHGSLLPRYRGAAPIHWAVINGEKETGVTTFKLKHDIDTGNILFQEKIPILDTDTTGDVHDRMMGIGAQLVLKTVRAIESNDYELIPQDSAEVSKAPKIHKEDAEIQFDMPVKKVYDFIRGMSPFPGAWTLFEAKMFKIYFAHYVQKDHDETPGTFSFEGKNHIRFYCTDGYILPMDVQLAGKKRMPVKDFLNGYFGG